MATSDRRMPMQFWLSSAPHWMMFFHLPASWYPERDGRPVTVSLPIIFLSRWRLVTRRFSWTTIMTGNSDGPVMMSFQYYAWTHRLKTRVLGLPRATVRFLLKIARHGRLSWILHSFGDTLLQMVWHQISRLASNTYQPSICIANSVDTFMY